MNTTVADTCVYGFNYLNQVFFIMLNLDRYNIHLPHQGTDNIHHY